MMRERIESVWKFVWRNQLLLFLPLVFILAVNGLHEKFPDEYDNILGGYYIKQGILPYKGFFSHHGPVSYFLAAVITLVSGRNFVYFRFILGLFYLGYFFGIYYYFKNTFKQTAGKVLLGAVYLIGFAGTYYWGHMLVADSLASYFALFAYGLVFYLIMRNRGVRTVELIAISSSTSLVILTSVTYVYFVALIYAFTFLLIINEFNKARLKHTGIQLGLLGLPYLVFLAYLLLSGSAVDFYKQAILYNKNTYIYNYPRTEGSTTINPVRYAIVILYTFFQNYRGILMQIKDFNFGFPFNVTLALANLSILVMTLYKRRFTLFAFILLALIYSNPRSSPLTSAERDFQSAVYIVISFFNLAFVFPLLIEEINKGKYLLGRVISSVVFSGLGIYSLFFFLFVVGKFFDRFYLKYMGREPLIYNRPVIAPILNQLTTSEEYVWVGPLEFEELLYIHAKQPSKYYWFLRAHSETEEIKRVFMEDLREHKPKIVVYKKDFSEYGSAPGSMNSLLMNFLNEGYFQIGEKPSPTLPFKTNFKEGNFIMTTEFYFSNENRGELIEKLKEMKLIQEEAVVQEGSS